MKTKNVFNMICIILVGLCLISQVIINVVYFEYWHGNVKLDYNAKLQQCDSLLEKYNENTEDLINYEKTNEDRLAVESFNQIKNCRYLLSNPERFTKGIYLNFYTYFIMINILSFVAITCLCALISFATYQIYDSYNKKDEDKYDDQDTYY